MLEDQVAFLLQRYLGNYVRGLNKEALKISVWRGDVVLTNMQLKPEALNALKLPVRVKAGFLGSVRLKVPWSRLGHEPVVVYLDQILILAEPATQVEGCSEDVVQEVKRSRVRDMEAKLIESQQQFKSEINSSWIGSFINTIIGNLKLTISNVHIRYEDMESNPGHPFAAGLMLHKLSAVTIDDSGLETFATGGALERIQKSVELQSLAFYFDSDACPWNASKPWEDLLPFEWIEIFEVSEKDGKTTKDNANSHSYVLQPVSGNARYKKLHADEARNTGQSIQKAVVNLDDVTLCLSKDGYRDILKLADNFNAFNQRLRYAHYRPASPIQTCPRSWWKYGYKAVVEELKKASGKFSWEHVLKYARLRKRYVTLYASLLKSDLNSTVIDDNEEINEMDRELDIEVILQWRMLAHKFLAQSVEYNTHINKQKTQKSWWSLGWSPSASDGSETKVFTDEDWERLNRIIGYKEGPEEKSVTQGSDQLISLFEVHMKHNASRLVNDCNDCLADLSCDGIDFSLKMYSETIVFDLKLGSYRLLSPNGLLAESASISDSLVCVFSYKPFGTDLDWSFVAKASPCYVTYLKESVDDIISFYKHGTAISQTIVLETAAAVQVRLDEVRRTAQQKVTRALKEHARFSLDLDIAAPKITIPTNFSPDNFKKTKLLLDFGNLILSTKDYWELATPDEMNAYLQFNVILSDVAAFLVDGDHSWDHEGLVCSSYAKLRDNSFLPVIDKCMIVLSLQQVLSENPLYPSTRISVRLPSIRFCFSPARYHRLMHVLKIFEEERVDDLEIIYPWQNADIEGWISVLSWKGMTNREAIWKHRYLSLVGPFLYVLENPSSRSYRHYVSLRGKQVHPIPVELIGDEHAVAVFDSTRSTTKVMDDANAFIVRFENDELRRTWQTRLQGAIYRASGSAAIDNLSETSSSRMLAETPESVMLPGQNGEILFVIGVLDELRICFTSSYNHEESFKEIILANEHGLFEVRAIGGQVELSLEGNDLFVGTILKSLEIEDQFQHNNDCVPHYLARSFIQTESDSSMTAFFTSTNGSKDFHRTIPAELDAEEQFFEASDSLGDMSEDSIQGQEDDSNVGIKNHVVFSKISTKPPSFFHILGLLPDVKFQAETEIGKADTFESFVKVHIVSLHQDSPLYNGIDMQISVTLSTLSFFCRRPTILAILQFLSAINSEEGHQDHENGASSSENRAMVSNKVFNQSSEASKDTLVKGLLGRGKSRVLFYLRLNMARAHIFLVIEDESCLATLLQNNLLAEIKVFPSSFSIKAALGNLKISDDSLQSAHPYFWVCDMRDPNGTSFVELDFTSFSTEDDDYRGYDYSLVGHFSEVRIIYLHRFVQEVVAYFAGLATNNPRGVIKLKDHVANIEKVFTVDEIEGSPALKLDVSLSRPIILLPQNTDSTDYLEVDVLHISVTNTFYWIGGDKNVMNSVHLEIMDIQVEEINLSIGSADTSGENIIEDISGLSIVIRRSLRDLLQKIPLTEVVIQVKELRAALSNREYHVIMDCATSNISEVPRVLPRLAFDFLPARSNTYINDDSLETDVAEAENQNHSWISLKISVSIDLVELHLLSGTTRDLALATIQAIGAWILYKTNSYGESFLLATLKGFNVIDDREGTKDEFRQAIAMHNHSFSMSHNSELGRDDDLYDSSVRHLPLGQNSVAVSTMLILDVIFKRETTNLSLCVQRPHLLVALDFLLAIGEFFAPSLRTLLSDENRTEDSLPVCSAIFLDHPVYYQPSLEFSLSPRSPFIVDDARFDNYIYDGNGGTLYLNDDHGNDISCTSCFSFEPIFFVGNGKRLQFKNVFIKNGLFLDSCIFLGSNSHYSASESDNVFLEEGTKSVGTTGDQSEEVGSSKLPMDKPAEIEYLIELQAIGPEFTFYTNTKDITESLLLSKKHFHAELDLLCRLVIKGDRMEVGGDMLGLKVESNGIRVLEPFDTSVKFSTISGRKNISISVSHIFMNFSYNLMMLFMAVEEEILTYLRMTSKKICITCSQFDRVGTLFDNNGEQKCTFWRPRAPSGFAVLGDCVTPWNEPPSKGVLAVNTSFINVRKPLSYELIWPLDIRNKDPMASVFNFVRGNVTESCSIWFPVAPKGYVALGCVISVGNAEPPLSSSLCIMDHLTSPCLMRDCIYVDISQQYSSVLSFWRVENSFGTFLVKESGSVNLNGMALDLRDLLLGSLESSPKSSVKPDMRGSSIRRNQANQLQRSPSSVRLFEPVASFKMIWWNQGATGQKKLSIWRPIIPEGMFYFGDIVVQGYESPHACFVLRDIGDDNMTKPPLDFHLVGKIRRFKKLESISLWLPEAPPGYVSLGCIASKSLPGQGDFVSLRCLRSDMVVTDEFPEESIWDSSWDGKSKELFSIWSVSSEVGTFIARRGTKRPPKRHALKLADVNVSNNLDNIVLNAQIKTLSAAVYDDYGSLMVPLFNISFSGLDFNMLGRPDFTNLTVSFMLTGRSYNDKLDTWEPLIEPLDGFLRYQYDLNAPGAVSQLRLASTRDLNLNVSTSNINMLLQAYSSWKSLSHVQASYTNTELTFPQYCGQSIIDVHHKRDYYIIPQNKLGCEMYIRATEMRRYSSIIKMLSGDNKPIKIPVSKNLLDSHLNGRQSRASWSMVTIIIYSAELHEKESECGSQYAATVRLTKRTDSVIFQQQSARTCGVILEPGSSSGLFRVDWNEMFFFRADCLDNYVLEFVVMDVGTGKPVGFYSSSLESLAVKFYANSNLNVLFSKWTWVDLCSANFMINPDDLKVETWGKIKCAVLFAPGPAEKPNKNRSVGKNSGFLQISPTFEGPWTTVRLNYATSASCWRLGNDVVASELTVRNGIRYVNIRSLVSLTNNTDFVIDLCLKSKCTDEKKSMANVNDYDDDSYASFYETDVFFETEEYAPLVGWVNSSSSISSSSNVQNMPNRSLPSGWELVIDWYVDNSTVKDSDGWVYAQNVENLRWPDSLTPLNVRCNARWRKWVRHRKYVFGEENNEMPLNTLRSGDTVALPLRAVVHPLLAFYLQLRPINVVNHHQYSWSAVKMKYTKDEALSNNGEFLEIFVSNLTESDMFLHCTEVNSNTLSGSIGLWFYLSIQATEIGKDIHLNPLYDWEMVVNSPLSITNYLPHPAEYSLLRMLPNGQFFTCSQGNFLPGEKVNIYSVHLQEALYLTLHLPGWETVNEPILISHPSKLPSRTANLRSSFSGRVVQIIFEQQNHDSNSLMARHIRIYAPYWICSTGCPPLIYRLLDMPQKKRRQLLSSEISLTGQEKVIWDIREEEMHEGCTIVSVVSFKNIGLSLSIAGDQTVQFGPVKDMSPLGDMDGFLDMCAYDSNGNCFEIFITSTECPHTAVPTKVINLRPFMTFTNRTGQNIYLKFNPNDQPKTLLPSDSRVSFIYNIVEVSYKLQVKLEGTAWSFPIEISKEDSFVIMLRNSDGCRSFLRVEIRGYEEGSRFLLVFRPGTSSGMIRVENRVGDKAIRFRQSGFIDDDAWIQLHPFSTTDFSWENPYGPRCLDVCVGNEISNVIQILNLDTAAEYSNALSLHGIQTHMFSVHDLKIVCFKMLNLIEACLKDCSDSLSLCPGSSSSGQDEMQHESMPLEVIIELAVVGVSLIDHKPRELLFLYMERVFVSYSTGYDAGTTDRFKLVLGQVQVDNQLPLTVMPVLLAAEKSSDASHQAFKATITMKNTSSDGTQVYPYVYVRVADTSWKLNIHEPVIWALVDFFKNIHLGRLSIDSDMMQVDPEIRIDLIDISEIRLRLSLETSPTQRPHGVLGVWSPILSAVGNALKIQIHLRKVMHQNRFIRQSNIIPSILNRVRRDLIHDPLHLIFSVDVLGMTKSTFASLSKGFAELSTDGQFLQLRSKQVWSRRITGVGDGILQGTEALAQGVAFGVYGVVTKPIENARQNGLLGFARGLGQAFLGVIVQPVSGALDFVSLTVDGINTSFARCLEILNNRATVQRIRNPRAIRANSAIKEYSEKEAIGQMVLYLAESSRRIGCTDLFKEPSKYAWSDYYEDHFSIPHHRILLVTNKRIMLLQCLAPDKMDKQPCKIVWDVPWENILALELAKAGYPMPSHLIIHLKQFKKSESFVKLIKCHTAEDIQESHAINISSAVHRIWKAHLLDMKTLTLKVPSSQRNVQFALDEADEKASIKWSRPFLKPRDLSTLSDLESKRFTRHVVNFQMIWSSESVSKNHFNLHPEQVLGDDQRCSIWRPSCPDGYISVGDIAHLGVHSPHVSTIYKYSDKAFAPPLGYDLVWRNCADDFSSPLTIWHPRASEGFMAIGCVAVASFEEPQVDSVYCVRVDIAEETEFEQLIWTAPNSYPWSCYLYQVQSEALHFVSLRQPKEKSSWKPMRVSQEQSSVHSPGAMES